MHRASLPASSGSSASSNISGPIGGGFCCTASCWPYAARSAICLCRRVDLLLAVMIVWEWLLIVAGIATIVIVVLGRQMERDCWSRCLWEFSTWS